MNLCNLDFQKNSRGLSRKRIMPNKYTSSQFDNTRFSAHGEYEIQWVDGIYIVSVVGPMNLECIKAMGQARAAAFAERQDHAPIVGIAEFHNSMLMSPDALAAYSAGLEKDLQCYGQWAALAWVSLPDVDGRSIMEYLFSKVFAKYHVPWRLFEDMDAAKAWVAAFRTSNTG